MAGLPATGCGVGSADGKVQLKLVAVEYGSVAGTGSTTRYWKDVVAAFALRHPRISVDVTSVRSDNATEKINRMVRAGEAPDIAHVPAFASYATRGAIYRADEVLSLPVLADFEQSIATAGEQNRVQYGMPVSASVFRLYYNKDLFESAGLDPEDPPQNWEDLRAAAEALHDAGVPVPFALPLGHDDAYAEATMWMISGGGGLSGSLGSYTINSPVNVDTFAWLRDELVGPGLTGSGDPARTPRDEIEERFAAGEVGLVTANTLLMGRVGTSVRYGTTTMPGTEEPVLSTLGDATWVVAFNDRDHRDDINTFLDFVFTTDAVTGFAERHGLLPTTRAASDALSASESAEDRLLQPFLDELPGAQFYPMGKSSWATVAAALAKEIGEAVQPGSNPERILSGLQRQAEEADEASEIAAS